MTTAWALQPAMRYGDAHELLGKATEASFGATGSACFDEELRLERFGSGGNGS